MTVPSSSPHEVTQLLIGWSNGDNEALDRGMPLVYEELRRLARHCTKRERPRHTLQTTALSTRPTCGLSIKRTRAGKTGRTSSASPRG
jgi:hypothetical protein